MPANSISLDILISYTIPLSYLLALYIIYTALHILLLLDSGVYVLFLLLHYVPALIYVVHRIAANFSIRNVLVSTVFFLLFPVHFILTLYYKILFSLKIIKINPSQTDETSSLLDKVRADNPFHTFLITFTCVQIPLEVLLQMAIYLNHFRNGMGTTILTIANLTVCLLLTTYGAVSYFRYETQNMKHYLLSRATLKRVNRAKVQAERTFSKTPKTMSQFKVDSNSNLKITDSHSVLFKVIVSMKWLIHNYIRLVSVGLVLFYYPMFTIIFFTAEAILFFLILLFCQLKSGNKLTIGYDILQSLVLNFCLIEYQIELSRKLIFISYFLIIFAENLLFNYLWYFTVNGTRRHKTLFTSIIWSLFICQVIHFLLLFVYLFFYEPKMFEIDYYAEDTEDEGIDTNLSENEEEIRSIDDETEHNGFQSQSSRYENVAKQNKERDKKTTASAKLNVDRIRTPTTEETHKRSTSQVAGQKVAFDNLIYAKIQKHSVSDSPTKQDPPKPVVPAKPSTLLGTASASKYKELINDLEEQTVYSQSGRNPSDSKKEEMPKSLTASYGVNPEQRDSWKYIVEEIDDQIHKSTSNLNKSKLHLSSDRLSRKHNRSTDSLDRATPRGSLSLPATQLIQTSSETSQRQNQQNLFETSHTKSYSHVKQGGKLELCLSQGTSVDPIETIDRQEEEETIMENKYADNSLDRRTSRYSSQEFVETRRVDETTYEERKMNVKKLNTTSLV